MNFQKVRESDEVELLLKNRLVSLVLYLKEIIDAGQFDEMSLAQIAKDKRMTIPRLMAFGFTKANLVCHVVVAENEVLIQKWMGLDWPTMGFSLTEQGTIPTTCPKRTASSSSRVWCSKAPSKHPMNAAIEIERGGQVKGKMIQR